MSVERLCSACHGTGEGGRLERIPGTQDVRDVLSDCLHCGGSGFDRGPTAQDLRSARAALVRSTRALNSAVRAMRRPFGKKGA